MSKRNTTSSSSEQDRVSNLESYRILDTQAEPEFDEITELAAQITGLPITLISLVDDRRQWFKSKVGLDVSETEREISFCQYTIQEDQFFEVRDAQHDPQFADNPLVTGHPNIGYYYGYPIKSAEGHKLGSLCTIGHEPYKLNQKQKRALKILGHQVENLLKLRKQNLALAHERDRANENARAKSAFLSTMSHEIRTPLNSIINFSHLLANEKLGKRSEQYVRNLRFASENLLSLLNDILDFNKLEADKLQLNKSSFNLKELLEKIVEIFSFKARENEVRLELRYDKQLPQYLVSDQHRLTQVLNNLVSNAVKFTERGTVILQAQLMEKQGERVRLRLSVRDTGIGIPKNKQKSIFQKFTQASPQIASKYGGTGLGLNISSRLLKLFHSELQLESEEGQGSEFYFEMSLPISTQREEQSRKLSGLKGSLKGMRILLAEDNELNGQIMERLCELWGAELTWVKNGALAVEQASDHPFDIVLMDIEMPQMDGREAARALKERDLPLEAPIFAMTAHALNSLNELEGGACFDGLVSKPIHAPSLQGALSSVYLRQ